MRRIASDIDQYTEFVSNDAVTPGSSPSSHKSDETEKAQLILGVGSILLLILVGCILNCIRSRHQRFRKLIRSWSQYDKKNNYLNIDESSPETANAGAGDIPTVIFA